MHYILQIYNELLGEWEDMPEYFYNTYEEASDGLKYIKLNDYMENNYKIKSVGRGK